MLRMCNVVLCRIWSLGLRLHILLRIVGHKRNKIQEQYTIQVVFTGFDEWLGLHELWLSADIKVLAKISLLLIWRWYKLHLSLSFSLSLIYLCTLSVYYWQHRLWQQVTMLVFLMRVGGEWDRSSIFSDGNTFPWTFYLIGYDIFRWANRT